VLKILFSVLVFPIAALSQTTAVDSLPDRQLDEVMVTATRNERTMGLLPMPVSLVSNLQIRALGSLRLTDVLTEQTGLIVVPQVNGMGSGIQMQGLNPDYTLILIDGEPLIGRYTGSLELSRITVGNIKQIEIVKGPSSSLYGSDALAGVINIITERPTANKVHQATRYGTNNTLDVNGDVSIVNKKLGVYLFGNRYSTDGYDLSPENFGKTVSPFVNHTLNTKITYQLSPSTDLSITGRAFIERQQLNYEVDLKGEKTRTQGHGNVQDWNFNPVLTHKFSENFKTTLRFYSTAYATDTELNLERNDSLYYTDDFNQTFSRPEINGEYFINEKNILTVGAGYINETVQTSRYGDQERRRQETSYGFFQYEWMPQATMSVILGGRYDKNSIYGNQFSPKLSTRYELNEKVTLKLSGGVGFKAPDFRQLYFNFFNSAAGGYSVLGTEIATVRLAELQALGQINTYFFDPASIGNLQAERSLAVNMGAHIEPTDKLKVDINLFHNSINNLIETQPVAITTSGQSIYSYRNIQRAFTQGLESNLTQQLTKRLSISAGYQLLFAKDKDVADKVKDGKIFWREEGSFTTRRLRPNEYIGLYNRSRHTGNVKLFYQNHEHALEGTLRVVYRNRFGVGDIRGNIQGEVIPPSDVNSNNVLDTYDNFVDGYAQVNVSVAKTFFKAMRVQVGIDNVFNYTDPIFIPNLPGRLCYASIQYTFSKNNVKPN
jgi:outer membrane receptor for ferrienterochelin and colicins